MVSISSLPQKHCEETAPIGESIYPTIKSIDTTPVKVTPLKGLGYRGKMTIQFVDFPLETGTYFGRLMAANPYYLDRPMKLYNGFYSKGETLDLAGDFQEKLYFIKSIDGPSDKGIVTFEAVDILSKLDSDQAIAPLEYELKLKTEILKENPTDVTCPALDATETGNVEFTNGDKLPKGITRLTIESEYMTVECDGTTTVDIISRISGAAHAAGTPVTVSSIVEIEIGSQYTIAAGSYYVRIDDEILLMVRSAGDVWNVGLRAQYGTKEDDHDHNEAASLCYIVDNENVVDVIYNLIDEFTDIDVATYIDLTEWEQERDDYLLGEVVDLVISESTPVKKLIEELTSQTYILLWWDDTSQKIKLRSIGPNIASTKAIDHNRHILNSGHRLRTSQAKAINEVWVYYERKDWSGDKEKASNYKNLYIYVDVEASANLGARKVKKIFADSIRTESTAAKISKRYVAQNKTGYKTLYFRLDPADAADINLGDTLDITTDLEQDINGIPVQRNYLVILKDDKINFVEFQAEATGFFVGEDVSYARIAPDNMTSFASASAADKLNYAFLADSVSIEMSDGSNPYLIIA